MERLPRLLAAVRSWPRSARRMRRPTRCPSSSWPGERRWGGGGGGGGGVGGEDGLGGGGDSWVGSGGEGRLSRESGGGGRS